MSQAENAQASTDKDTGLQVYFRLLSYVKPLWLPFAISLFGFFLFAITQPLLAWLLQFVVDSMQTDHKDQLYLIPLAIISVIVLRGVGSFLGSYFLAKVGNTVIYVLRNEVFDHYTLLPNAYFDNNNSGHLISRITFNVTQVTSAATDALKVMVREGFTVIGLLAFLLYKNWQLSMVFLLLAPVIAIVVRFAGQRFRKISKKIQSSMGEVTQVSSELINGYRVVRSFGGEEYEKRRFRDASNYNFRQSLRMVKSSAIHTPVLQLLIAVALSLLVYLAMILMEDASAGEFVSYVMAAFLIPKPVRQLSEVNSSIQKGIAAAESVFEVLDEPREVDTGRYETGRAEGRLTFRHVGFRYEHSDKKALDDIDFTIEPGQVVALVGHSGSGKSTLANLIPRFYDYQEGEILLDDHRLQEYSLRNLRQQIALVTQSVTLFNDTVANNIAYGELAGAERERIIEAARQANAYDFIQNMPDGFDTRIGEDGVKLSGGQRQRLAIARALLKDTPILILDEATSALDTQSERKIQQALDVAMAGRTTLVIAHRLSTVEKADKILVLKNGRIVESGTHQDLLEKDGHYAALYYMQFRNESAPPMPRFA